MLCFERLCSASLWHGLRGVRKRGRKTCRRCSRFNEDRRWI